MSAWDSDVGLTVEVGFGYDPLDPAVVWTDVSAYVRQIVTDRGRSRVLDQTQAGTAFLIFDNTDSRFHPENTSGAYTPDVKPMVQVRISAVHNVITYRLWYGFVTSWSQEYPEGVDAIAVAQCVDGFRLMAMYEKELTESQEGSGVRIGNLLDTMGWPAAWRAIDSTAGKNKNVQALSAEFNSILFELRRTALVEDGLLFIAGDGNLTFRDGQTRIEDNTVQETFSDDGADLSYSEPIFDYDTSQIWNDVSVTRVDGTDQNVSDATSISTHGPADLRKAQTLHVADGEARALADWYLSEFKDIRPRVSNLTLYPGKDEANLWPAALGLELWDAVNVERTPPSSSVQDQIYFVERIQHDISKVGGMHWNTHLSLSPQLAFTDWWILGTSALGTDTRLAY